MSSLDNINCHFYGKQTESCSVGRGELPIPRSLFIILHYLSQGGTPNSIPGPRRPRSTSLWKASCSKAIERQTVVGGKYIMMPLKLKANTKGKEHKRQDKIEAEVRKHYKFKNEETRKLARIKHIKH